MLVAVTIKTALLPKKLGMNYKPRASSRRSSCN
jgi:hypothetical protein